MADDFAKHDDITDDILKASKNVRHVTKRKRKQSLVLSEYLCKKCKKGTTKLTSEKWWCCSSTIPK